MILDYRQEKLHVKRRVHLYKCFDILVFSFDFLFWFFPKIAIESIFITGSFKMGRGLDASTNLGKVLLVSSGFGIVLALIGIIGEFFNKLRF